MAKYKKRSDGRYATSIRYCGQRYYFVASSSSELDRKVAAFKQSKTDGIYNSNMMLKDWASQWLITQRQNIQPNTWETYEGHIRLHILPELGRYKLCNLQPAHIRTFITKLADTLSTRSIEHIYVTLKALLQQAVDDDLLAKNPMRNVKKPHVTRTRPWVALTEQQIKKLLETVKNPMHQLIIKLAAASGLRRSELLGLRIQDIDMHNCTVSVRQTVKKIRSQSVICDTTKTPGSRRTVSLPVAIIPLIRRQITANENNAASDTLWQPNGLLFPGEHGSPLSPDWITHIVSDYGKRAGMPDGFCLNSLRHTSASLLLQHGASYKVVQERLGHSTANLTLNTYSHVMPGQDKAAAELLSAVI